MAVHDSTLSPDNIEKIDYDEFALDFSFRLHQIKSKVAGAKALSNETDIDLLYLLSDAFDDLRKMAEEISGTEGKFKSI